LSLLKHPPVLILLTGATLATAGFGMIDPTLGPYMMSHLGYGQVTIGLAFALTGFVYTVVTPFAG
jgi:hypothetical protein